jgi:4-diphosphocytidyl-2-C-methyl-D-erythritol kinase
MKIQIYNDQVRVASPAKLNLFLEIHAKRTDGFHQIETVMTRFSLFDFLTFHATPDDQLRLSIQTNRRIPETLPSDGRNLIVQSLQAVRNLAGRASGAVVTLVKNIPVQAGLGGSSGNAAAALLAANQIWHLNWPIEKLRQIAHSIGSDVAFFLGNSLARCTGKGEQVYNLYYPCRLNVVVAKPPFGMSTADIYSRCRVPDKPISSEAMLAGLKSGRHSRIGISLFNRLEQSASVADEGIITLRREFEKTNCLGHQLTGSGSCYFGIYRNNRSMHRAARLLANRMPDAEIFTGQTLGTRDQHWLRKD